jgi:hypothetical protein
VRASLARLHLECVGQAHALQLLGQGELRESLAACDPANFMKPWVFIYVRRGRATRIVMAQRFVD